MKRSMRALRVLLGTSRSGDSSSFLQCGHRNSPLSVSFDRTPECSPTDTHQRLVFGQPPARADRFPCNPTFFPFLPFLSYLPSDMLGV